MATYSALTKEQSCKFMILLRGPFPRGELAGLIGVKRTTIYGWECLGKEPTLDHLRALLMHFSRWYVDEGLPGTLEKALAEITGKKPLTRLKPRDKTASNPNPSAEKEAA